MNEKNPNNTVLNTQRKLFFGLFIFPLLIAVGMAALLCSVVLLTSEKETPESLLAAIKTGSAGKRWQKAFELSNELSKKTDPLRRDSLVREIAHILRDPGHYDAKTRSYMAIALSHFDTPESIQALTASLGDGGAEVQTYALWALGALKSKQAVPDCLRLLRDDDPELRKMVAYVLGSIGEKSAVDPLKTMLTDPVNDVRWNAALSLARLGDDAGTDVLINMLDRKKLNAENDSNETITENIMINAIKGLTLIAKPDSIKILQELSKNDPSLKVRQVAIESLKIQKKHLVNKTL